MCHFDISTKQDGQTVILLQGTAKRRAPGCVNTAVVSSIREQSSPNLGPTFWAGHVVLESSTNQKNILCQIVYSIQLLKCVIIKDVNTKSIRQYF